MVSEWDLKEHSSSSGRTYLAKVNLVKDDLVGMCDAPEARNECEHSDYCQSQLVIPFILDRLFGLLLHLSQVLIVVVCRLVDKLGGASLLCSWPPLLQGGRWWA